MSVGFLVLLAVLLGVLTLAAYVDRIYSEMGRFLAREFEANLEVWETRVEPRLHLGREAIALSASVLRQLAIAAMAMLFGYRLYVHDPAHYVLLHSPGPVDVLRAIAEFILLLVVYDRLIPQILFSRTDGVWVVSLRPVLQVLLFLVQPVTLLLGLLLSIAALAEPEDEQAEEHPSEAMDALLEAGEEEGILHESDRELVRSVVEFGDKLVREVMTPRPEIFAVPGSMTLEQFTAAIAEHAFSRVPVFGESLDDVTGIAFAHDLLQVPDTEAALRSVAEMQRAAAFVPETKNTAELLREMQREKQHMRLVIDEYGGVAGLVTIEDLLEAIVGEINDEHDTPEDVDSVTVTPDGELIGSGTVEVSQLRDVLLEQLREREDRHDAASEAHTADEDDGAAEAAMEGDLRRDGADRDADETEEWAERVHRLGEGYEATTLGGLVSEMAGHIPHPGEVVEEQGLRFEVLAATERRVDRVKVSMGDIG